MILDGAIEEIEANDFAIALLLPEAAVKSYLAERPFDLTDDAAFVAMAKRFQVPLAVLGVRLGNLRRKR